MKKHWFSTSILLLALLSAIAAIKYNIGMPAGASDTKQGIEIVQDIFYEAISSGEIQTTTSKVTLAKLFCATLDGCVIQDELMGEKCIDYKEVRDFYTSLFV